MSRRVQVPSGSLASGVDQDSIKDVSDTKG